MSAETWGVSQFHAYLGRQYGENADIAIRQVRPWLNRGDGVAIYENHDLGHPDIGHPDIGQCQLVSFGSRAAQLGTDSPPDRLPDIGGAVNWRYVLIATYREAGNGRQHGLVEAADRGRADPRPQPGKPGVGEGE